MQQTKKNGEDSRVSNKMAPTIKNNKFDNKEEKNKVFFDLRDEDIRKMLDDPFFAYEYFSRYDKPRIVPSEYKKTSTLWRMAQGMYVQLDIGESFDVCKYMSNKKYDGFRISFIRGDNQHEGYIRIFVPLEKEYKETDKPEECVLLIRVKYDSAVELSTHLSKAKLMNVLRNTPDFPFVEELKKFFELWEARNEK